MVKKDLIVGLDMSTVSTGLVIMSNQFKVTKAVTIKFPSKKDQVVYTRIIPMSSGIIKHITRLRNRIKMVIIEDVYNIRRNSMCLLELRGMVILGLSKLGIPFQMMAANTARYGVNVYNYSKKAKKLTSEQKKELIKQWVEEKFNYKFADHDQSDAALLVAAYLKEHIYD